MRCGGDRRNKLLVIADFPMRFRVKNLIRLVIKKNLISMFAEVGRFLPFLGGELFKHGTSFLLVSFCKSTSAGKVSRTQNIYDCKQ